MEGPDMGVRFAAQARTCEAQGLQTPLGRGLMRTGTPCKLWPLEEEQVTGVRTTAGRAREVVLSFPKLSEARGLAGRAREVVMVTDTETGRQTKKMRVADGMSEKEGQETRNVYGGAGGMEQETRRADPAAGEQAERAPWPGKEGQDQ